MSSKRTSVILTYASSGAQPPIFLAGSFSEPAWLPQEMEVTSDENGELNFHKEVEVEQGIEYQYKFRIGLGDWWAVNEQVPTVTDDLGNRNNLLTVPSAKEIPEESKSSEEAHISPISALPVPEVIVEKVDDEPRHGDDFGTNATIGQKDAHDMRALDAEPDHIVIRSQTSTPVYANTAAEVADSAAILDREPSPTPISDDEAGRTGLRRMSGTPIPQVALTAAEVADTAAIIDRGDDDYDEMEMNVSQIYYPSDTPSGATTPWHERAPLFAHELAGTHLGETEFPVRAESFESPSKPDPEEQVIDLNDPTLERFPEDRMSILTHIRSCESRMSEDETNIQGIPPSPITKPKSRSPSIETPGSTRLDAQPSPALDVITEEHQEEDSYFTALGDSSQKLQDAKEIPLPEKLNAVDEMDEPDDDPRTVLENIKKIEQATADSYNNMTKQEHSKQEVNTDMPEKESGFKEGYSVDSRIDKKVDGVTKAKESSTSNAINAIDSAENSEPGPVASEVEKECEDDSVVVARHTDLKASLLPEKVSGTSEHTVGVINQEKTQDEEKEENISRRMGQSYTPDGPDPEVHNDPSQDFREHVEINKGHGDVEEGNEFQDTGELVQAVDEHHEGKSAVDTTPYLGQSTTPRLQYQEAVVLKNEDPHGELKTVIKQRGEVVQNEGLEDKEGHLPSVEEDHVLQQPLDKVELTHMRKYPEFQQSQLDHVNAVLSGEASMKDLPAQTTNGRQDVAKESTIEVQTVKEGILDAGAYQPAVTSEESHAEAKVISRDDLPVSGIEVDELSQNPVSHLLRSEEEIEQAPRDVDKLTVVENQQLVTETSHTARSPVVKAEADGLLSRQQEALDTQIPKSVLHVEDTSKEEPAVHKLNPPISQTEAEGEVSEMQVPQTLDTEVDEVVAAGETHAKLQTGHEADPPISNLIASDVNSGRADTNNVDGNDSILANGVDSAKPISVDAPCTYLHDHGPELTPHKSVTQNMERPHTPSSIRSPTKASESQPQKSIWRSVFGDWFGGLLASLCGGDRGPLLAITAVVVLGPLLAMYLLKDVNYA